VVDPHDRDGPHLAVRCSAKRLSGSSGGSGDRTSTKFRYQSRVGRQNGKRTGSRAGGRNR
jgi:hypothetical protein